ncbi:D-amino-acid oxidase, partial [Penicillium capsulatum]
QKVTIIARDLPGDSTIDYASPWAGAHFRPSPANTPAEQLEQEFMRETYRQFEAIADQSPEAGVQFIPAVEYFDSVDSTSSTHGMDTLTGLGFIHCRHRKIQLGVTYRSWVLNSPVYLQWLKRRAVQQGIQFIRAQVSTVEDALTVSHQDSTASQADDRIRSVIDTSGRGLNDPSSFPSRGQFILVSNQCDRTTSHHWADGSSTVIIPRPLGGGTVIGGTKEPNNWSERVSEADIEEILQRAARICPALVNQDGGAVDNKPGFDIRQVYVARRPMRHGGLRLEKESLSTHNSDGSNISLIHCYGAGPSGYKISWGVSCGSCCRH